MGPTKEFCSMVNHPLLSALFVDFDNIFLGLQKEDPKAAHTFGAHPEKWLAWLEKHLQQRDGRQRRIAVRCCYLNPDTFSCYRPCFMKAGFEVVDCPTLTTSGKNSADIRIVVDMLELADFKVTYEEYILLSADADFTPVLLKLRKRGSNIALLAVGNSSPIYRACCDTVLDQQEFVKGALTIKAASALPPISVLTPIPSETKQPATEKSVSVKKEPIVQKLPAEKQVALAMKEVSKALTPAELEHLAVCVREHVQSAPEPVTLGTLAHFVQTIRSGLGPPDWAGHKTFKALLKQLESSGLKRSAVPPGYVYIPGTHTPPTEGKVTASKAKVSTPSVQSSAVKSAAAPK